MSNPFQDAADELDNQPSQPSAPVQQATAGTGNPFQDAAMELETADPAKPEPVQGAGTPDNPFSGVITFAQKIQEAREVGQLGFKESALGHAVMDGRMSFEDAEKQINEDTKFAQLTGDLDAYEKESAIPWLTGITLSTAKQLPMIEESLKPLIGGAVVGGGAAAATGLGAPLAVPVGLATGTTAAAGWAMDFITGQEYLEMRRRGLSHEVAAVAAPLSGFVQGSLQGLKFGSVGKLATNAARNVLAQHAQAIAHFIGEGAKFGLGQEIMAEAQTATKLLTQAIAGTVSKTPGAVPTMEEAVKEFTNTFNETLKGSIGLFVGGKVVGKASGLAFKTLLKKGVDAHLQKQQEKIQKLEEAQIPKEDSAQAPEANGESKTAIEKKRNAAMRLAKREAAEREIHRIFAAVNSRFYSETAETKIQESKRVQRLLKRMVTNSDKLDAPMKSRLLGRIVEINSVKDLLREGESFIEDQRGREHANDLAAAKKRLAKVIESGQLHGKKAEMPPTVQASLKWYKEFFTAPEIPKSESRRAAGETAKLAQEAALRKASEYVDRGIETERINMERQLEKLENNELSEIFNQPAEQAEKRRIAMQAMQYWSNALDAEKIQSLADQIETMVKTGKSEYFERKQAEQQKLENARAEILQGVQGNKPITPSLDEAGPKQLTDVGKLLNSLRRTSTSLWDKLLQDTPFEERGKLIDGTLDFTETENKESAINLKAAEKLTELYTKAVGSMREVNRLVRNGANKKERLELKYTDATGATGVELLTPNELAYLHLAFEDQGAVPGLVNGNKYTLKGMVESGGTSTQEAVQQLLTDHEGGKYIKLAEAVRDFYRWFAPQIANHYLKEYGVELPMDPNYSGQIVHRQLERIKTAADLLQGVHDFAKQSLDPGSVKGRKNSSLPIKLVDPFHQVQSHRAEMAFWIANSEKARLLSYIFSDSTKDGLRDVIEHKLGKEYTGLIDGRIAFQFHLKTGIMDLADRSFQKLKGNMATGLLGARLDQAPKQWTSVLATLSTNNYGEFLDGLRKATNKKNLQEYLSASELYADRQDHILNELMEATKERTFIDAVGPRVMKDRAPAIKTFFLTPMHKWGDGVAAALSGFIEFNRMRKGGASIEEAALAGDRLVDRTQSSSRASQKVPAEFKGGVANISLAFAKEGIQALNRESGAIRDWFIHKDEKSLARMARVILSIHVAQTLFQTINTAPSFLFGDEKEQEEARLRILSTAIGGSYSQLPLIGFDVIYGALSGFKGQQEPRTILGGLAGDSAKLIKRLWTITNKMATGEEIEGEDWVKAFKSIAGVASVATGLPFWGLFKYSELGVKATQKAGEGQ